MSRSPHRGRRWTPIKKHTKEEATEQRRTIDRRILQGVQEGRDDAPSTTRTREAGNPWNWD
jgi:hypothetical protein